MLLSRTLIAIFLLAASSAAQTFYGSVIGTVTDQTGSSVAGAAVTLVDLARSDRRTGQTDESGNYQFVNLVPGQYRVEIEKPGFRRFTREPITVEVQSAVRIDVPMQVGDVTQTVEVTGSDAVATNRGCVTRSRSRVPKGSGDAAQRPQRLRSGCDGCRSRPWRSVRHYADRHQSVCLGQLPDRRRTVQPERFLSSTARRSTRSTAI